VTVMQRLFHKWHHGLMRDRYWQAVFDALRPLINDTDVVLAPRGDWPAFQCASRFYDDVIEIEDCTVLVLHKDRLTAIQKSELRRIADQWQWIFANQVFIVLSRTERRIKDIRHCPTITTVKHCRALKIHLLSSYLRKRQSRLIYVHLPKTGGKSMFDVLTKAFPSAAYYSNISSYVNNPPISDDYDLIGLHFTPTVLLENLSKDDWLVGMVRQPTERFLSAVLHSRRNSEDPETFAASMKAMRDSDVADFLSTDLGRDESRLQLINLGADYRQSIDTLSDQEMLSAAVALVQRDQVIFAPSEHSSAFRGFLAKQLGFRPGVLRRLNANEAAVRRAHQAEFSRAIGLINAMNVHERELYDFVCRSFSARQTGEDGRARDFP
jgi:hypothetical protein